MKWVGNALMTIGAALLVATAVLYGYGQYERVEFERDQAIADRLDAATATAMALQQAVAEANERGRSTATALAEPTATAVSASVPNAGAPTVTPRPPTPTPTPVPIVLRRIVAPSIDLDAPVVESKIENGEWQVPKFVAGHLAGTSLPGTGGNIVLSGHVQSISSGNVFANIEKLKPGDEVKLRTNLGEVLYRIEGKNIVNNDDLSVVAPTKREELTLITCTGTFNPLTRDYDKRWIVWGVREG